MFKKIFVFFAVPSVWLMPLAALAQAGKPQPIGKRMFGALLRTGEWAGFVPDPNQPPDFLVAMGTYVNGILGLLGVVFLIWIIIGGFRWMTSSGDEEKIIKAKKTIVGASIGIGIILSAMIIVYFVFNLAVPTLRGPAAAQ